MDTQAVNNVGTQTAQKPKPVATISSSRTSSAPPPTEDTVSLSSEGKDLARKVVEPSSNSSFGGEQRKFSVTENNDVVLKVIDPQTREVVKSVPSEEELQLRDAIRNELDNT
ncbi:MAG: flagellar protein FlaG [Nitrospinae bacterium]|nr:flagellar protein FlaG [Nitrospinota bacterium]